MKMLLITTLYPGYANQSKIQATYAVHYFANEWARKNELEVIRLWPYYPNIFKCFKKARRVNKYAYKGNFMIDNVNVTRIPILKIPKVNYRNRDIKFVCKQIIAKFKKENYPDIIICDILNPSIYVGELVAKEFNSILVASLHNSDIFYLSCNKNYERYKKIDPSVDKIVFRSPKIEEKFLKIYDGIKNKNDYFTILFGIDKKEIIDKNKLENKIINPKREIMIASSLKKLKKVNIVIDAFAKVRNRKGYVLRIIGDGPERTKLENQVNDLGIENYVFFEGEKTRAEVLNYMEESNIFAMVSSPETFGLVYVEAMAKGCITIGSKGEGIDGVIVNNENGFLCSPDDTEGLKIVLEKAISLEINERKKIITNAINTANKLNNQDLADEYLQKIKGNIHNIK